MPRVPKGNKRRESESHPSDDLPQPVTYELVHGQKDVIATWHDALHQEDRKFVLDISVDELSFVLKSNWKRSKGASDPQLDKKFEEILDNSEIMSSLRSVFVNALHSDGVIEMAENELAFLMIEVMERHLLTLHYERVCVKRLLYFAAFMCWNGFWAWWIRYPLLIGLISVGFLTGFASRENTMRQRVLAPFNDQSEMHPDRLSGLVNSLLCGILSLSLSFWTGRFYSLVLIVSVMPMVLVYVERWTSSLDQSSLRFIRSALSLLSELCLLYLSYPSWTSLLFVMAFFFARTLTNLVSVICVVLFSTLQIIAAVQPFFLHPDRKFPYILSPLLWLYFLLWGRHFSWWWCIPSLCVNTLLTPSSLLMLAATACQLVGTYVAENGLNQSLVRAGQVLGILAVSVAWFCCAKKNSKPNGDREERRHFHEEQQGSDSAPS